MANVIALGFGYLLAICGFVLFFLQYRQGILLREARIKGNEELRQAKADRIRLEKDLASKTGECAKLIANTNKLDHTLNELQLRVQQGEAKQKQKLDDYVSQVRSAESRIENLQEQALALTNQLKEVDQEKRGLKEQFKLIADQNIAKVSKEADELRLKLKTVTDELREKTNLCAKLERNLAVELEKNKNQLDPAEQRKLKRRLLQYNQMYITMRGLKEMAEERNDNWQTALKVLSKWIVSKEDPMFNLNEAQIGPIVGRALQLAGGNLGFEDDHFEQPTHTPKATDLAPTQGISQTTSEGQAQPS